jgi:hypothetical protein
MIYEIHWLNGDSSWLKPETSDRTRNQSVLRLALGAEPVNVFLTSSV